MIKQPTFLWRGDANLAINRRLQEERDRSYSCVRPNMLDQAFRVRKAKNDRNLNFRNPPFRTDRGEMGAAAGVSILWALTLKEPLECDHSCQIRAQKRLVIFLVSKTSNFVKLFIHPYQRFLRFLRTLFIPQFPFSISNILVAPYSLSASP
jgi:hypothetical protein